MERIFSPLPRTLFVQTGFAARMRVDLRDAAADEPLVEAGPLRLALRMAGRTPGLERYDRDAGNYLAFPMPDGSCPVVEATLAGLRVGIPLGILAQPGGVRDVAVRVAGSPRPTRFPLENSRDLC